MSDTTQHTYRPDFVLPPGETVLETLEALGMTQSELAERIGKAPKTINEIVSGKAPITPETALQLERVLRAPARFWLALEAAYREWKAREEDQRRLAKPAPWLEDVPVAAMVRLGWIAKRTTRVERIQELLSFFGVASPEVWSTAVGATSFRRSAAFRARPGALAAWLRRGEILGQERVCADYSEARFRAALGEIRGLTREAPERFVPALEELCADAGVAVVWVPELPGTHVSGVTRWLGPTKGLIALSLRHKSDDHLWFTFFHEAGHILLHGKKDVFVDDGRDERPEEEAANDFAADFLLPRREFAKFSAKARFSKAAVEAFALEVGIAPGIVVGRLQHLGKIPHSHLNGLKRRFRWAASAG